MQKQVVFNYIYDKNYSPEYFTGILSSVSAQDELLLNFYLERNALPKTEVFNIKEDGNLEEDPVSSIPLNNEETINIVRHIKTGIMLDVDGAKNLVQLLEKYINITEERIALETEEE